MNCVILQASTPYTNVMPGSEKQRNHSSFTKQKKADSELIRNIWHCNYQNHLGPGSYHHRHGRCYLPLGRRCHQMHAFPSLFPVFFVRGCTPWRTRGGAGCVGGGGQCAGRSYTKALICTNTRTHYQANAIFRIARMCAQTNINPRKLYPIGSSFANRRPRSSSSGSLKTFHALHVS